jgi:2-polyprenyl-6-hydroxyphenyl methylase/3-demethylubiquinone-9 3-methyltransferase
LPADNSLYDIHAAGWWDENNFLHTLKTGLNPARFDYFVGILRSRGMQPAALRVLDVGCGGGFLSEEFSRLGCSVCGIDISAASITTAIEHARQVQLDIDYCVATAEALPLAAGSFDVVICCDVLEHVKNVEKVVQEAARVLKPNGLYLFDTINRSPRSFIETILVGQVLPFTRFFAPGTHDWRQFIRPDELKTIFVKRGLVPIEICGLQPGISMLETAVEIFRLKLGRISFGQFGRRLRFRHGGDTSGSYIGHAERKSFTNF